MGSSGRHCCAPGKGRPGRMGPAERLEIQAGKRRRETGTKRQAERQGGSQAGLRGGLPTLRAYAGHRQPRGRDGEGERPAAFPAAPSSPPGPHKGRAGGAEPPTRPLPGSSEEKADAGAAQARRKQRAPRRPRLGAGSSPASPRRRFSPSGRAEGWESPRQQEAGLRGDSAPSLNVAPVLGDVDAAAASRRHRRRCRRRCRSPPTEGTARGRSAGAEGAFHPRARFGSFRKGPAPGGRLRRLTEPSALSVRGREGEWAALGLVGPFPRAKAGGKEREG